MTLSDPPDDVRSDDGNIGLADFYAIPDAHQFIYMPARAFWPAVSVNSILPTVRMSYKRNGKYVRLKPSVWLKRHRRVEFITWVPGLPEIVEDRMISAGGWKDHPGAHGLNLYEPPTIIHGDPTQATPWIEHLRFIYPEDAEDITNWFAHRVQHPGNKINHALVLGGSQGIGKDFLLQALKAAVGPWNWQEVSPTDLTATFNPFVRAVVIRMNEAHDLGDSSRFDRFALYERIKIYAAAPPDVLPCVDKYIRRHYVPNVLGLVVTTNRKTDGIYLPSDDRRHFVCWSERAKENFAEKYWTEKWNWLLHEGGATHVAAYLARRDLKNFDPCAVPRATAAFEEIVNANLSPEDADLADALDELGEPKIVTLALILEKSTVAAALEWLLAPKSRRSIPHRLERCGYVAVRNPEAASNGLWRINGRRQTLYGKSSLTPEQRQAAATKYATEANTKAKTASNNGS